VLIAELTLVEEELKRSLAESDHTAIWLPYIQKGILSIHSACSKQTVVVPRLAQRTAFFSIQFALLLLPTIPTGGKIVTHHGKPHPEDVLLRYAGVTHVMC